MKLPVRERRRENSWNCDFDLKEVQIGFDVSFHPHSQCIPTCIGKIDCCDCLDSLYKSVVKCKQTPLPPLLLRPHIFSKNPCELLFALRTPPPRLTGILGMNGPELYKDGSPRIQSTSYFECRLQFRTFGNSSSTSELSKRLVYRLVLINSCFLQRDRTNVTISSRL